MSLLRQQPVAVQINRESCLVLQLSRQGQHFVVEHFSQQHHSSLSQQGLKKDGIVSALEYSATHYQKVPLGADRQVEEQLLQKLPPQLKTHAGISYDYLTHDGDTEAEAVIGQRSALENLLTLLAPLDMPVQVVEPVYQSVVRATNAVLPYLWPSDTIFNDPMTWVIVELRQPQSILLYCRNGVFQRLEYVNSSNLIPFLLSSQFLTEDSWLMSFGDKAMQSSLVRQLAEQPQLRHLVLSTAPFFSNNVAPIAAALDNEMALLGLALRGFSQWHR
ncbi:hypothetical protein [Idiomarina ramblicola]|uniref:Pilus assembly protein PilM n=1 Tax=Idiomarina ramblicola TaxID=263724 RepID=A0A432YSU9_9GAMM|nr:hypothetical protein [Idiomarina ramblicola]RUO64674.1 hypothetical protein CWI78_12280 [Idiomarina ramblicola]